MATIGALVVNLEARTSQFTAGMERARRTNQAFSASATGATMNIGKLRGSITTLAATLAGASGATAALGRFGSVLGALAVGGGPVVIAVAVVGALALAYRKLTENTRNAASQQDKLTEALKRTINAENEGLAAQVAVQTKKANDLRRQIGRMEGNPLAQGPLLGPWVAAKRRELAGLNALIAEGDARIQVEAWEKGAKGREEFARATKAAAESQQELTARFNQFWDDIEAKANLAGPAVVRRIEEMVAAQKKAASDKLTGDIDSFFERTKLHSGRDINRPEVFAKMERDAELFQQTWENAIRGTQEAFADFFENISRDGFKMRTLFENIARSIQRTFAELLARQLTNAIFGNLLGGLSPSLSSGRGNATQSMGFSRASSPAPTVIHQNITFNTGFVDGATGEAWLRSRAPVIAGVVAEAAGSAPAFARYIVAMGSK